MLSDVSLNSCLHLLRHRVLTHSCSDHGVLHKRAVDSDVRIMVLVDERFGRLAFEERHVLTDRVDSHHVIRDWHELRSVLDTQNL